MNREHQIRQCIQKFVDKGEIAGGAAAIWRDGRQQTACAGWRDMEADLPIERDTLFRIASMSKPITSVAALTLIDEGRLALSDPIAKYMPEFSTMRVLKAPDAPLEETEPCARPITVDDLLTHRAGFTYGDFHRGPIAAAYREALGPHFDSAFPPDEWIRRLASLPLIGQPGSAMYYGPSIDVLGFLIARIEQTALGTLLQRRIFQPLGMVDTGFFVPPEKRQRRACAYGFDGQGRLTKCAERAGIFVAERPPDLAYESGGGGLWSTLDDYIQFARLFLGDGAVDGVRLLRPRTLEMMMTNQLTGAQRAASGWLGRKPFAAGLGFGLGVSVVLEQGKGDILQPGSPGTVSWPGAFGVWWQADPKEQSVSIFLAQNMVDVAEIAKGIGLGVWAAIEQFQSVMATTIA